MERKSRIRKCVALLTAMGVFATTVFSNVMTVRVMAENEAVSEETVSGENTEVQEEPQTEETVSEETITVETVSAEEPVLTEETEIEEISGSVSEELVVEISDNAVKSVGGVSENESVLQSATLYLVKPEVTEVPDDAITSKTSIKAGKGPYVNGNVGTAKVSNFVTDDYKSYAESPVSDELSDITATKDTISAVSGNKTYVTNFSDISWYVIKQTGSEWHVDGISNSWREAAYKVSYVVDGTEVSSNEYTQGETVTLMADPEKEGSFFMGWKASDNLDVTGGGFAMPAKNVTITAVFADATDAGMYVLKPGKEQNTELTSSVSINAYSENLFLGVGEAAFHPYISKNYKSYAESDVADKIVSKEAKEIKDADGPNYAVNGDTIVYYSKAEQKYYQTSFSGINWYVIKNQSPWHVDGIASWTEIPAKKTVSADVKIYYRNKDTLISQKSYSNEVSALDENQNVDLSELILEQTIKYSGAQCNLCEIYVNGEKQSLLTVPENVKDKALIEIIYDSGYWGTKYLLKPGFTQPEELTSIDKAYNYPDKNYVGVAKIEIKPALTRNYSSYKESDLNSKISQTIVRKTHQSDEYAVDSKTGIITYYDKDATWTTNVNDVSWYVIKDTTAPKKTSWHMDGIAEWTKNPFKYTVSINTANGTVSGLSHVEAVVEHGGATTDYVLKADDGYELDSVYELTGAAEVSLDVSANSVIVKNVTSDVVLNLSATKNMASKKTLNYQINYYQDGTLVKTEPYRKEVWKGLSSNKIEVNAVVSANEYAPEYELQKIEIEDTTITELPEAVESGTIIHVYYANDKRYTVSFIDADSTLLGSAKYKYGAAVETVSEPSMVDPAGEIVYTFIGWKNEDGVMYGGEYAEFPVVTKDMVFKAVYAQEAALDPVKKFTVSFIDYNDSELADPQTLEGGSSVTVPADPGRTGYKFMYWKNVATGVTFAAADIPVLTEDTVYQAVYEENKTTEETEAPEKKKPVTEEETSTDDSSSSSSSSSSSGNSGSAGNVTTGVLGVQAAPVAPESGVLGAQAAPSTGDDNEAGFWLLMLLTGFVAAVGVCKKELLRK